MLLEWALISLLRLIQTTALSSQQRIQSLEPWAEMEAQSSFSWIFLNFSEFSWMCWKHLMLPTSQQTRLTPNFCKNLFRRDSVCPGNISLCQLTLHFNIKLQYKAINLVFGLWLQHKPALGQRQGHQDLGCGSHRVIKRVFGISLKFLQSLDAKTA